MASPDSLTSFHLSWVNLSVSSGDELEDRLRAGILAIDGQECPAQRKRRLASHECPRCWYLRGPRIAGQAFTAYKCGICDEMRDHPNTSTPRYCGDCCEAFALCGRCGGTIDGKRRRSGGRKK